MADALLPLVVIVGFMAIGWCFRTRGWWIPAAASAIAGFGLITTIPEIKHDVGGIGAMGAGVQMLAGLGLFGVAALCSAIGALVRRAVVRARAAESQAAGPELPVATVVAGGSGRSQDAVAGAVRPLR